MKISDNLEGNLSTILDFGVLIIAPYLSVYGLTQSQIAALVGAMAGLCLAYKNSRHDDDIIETKNRQCDLNEYEGA